MNGARQAWLVAGREMRERSRSPAFRASVAIMLITVVVMIAVPSLLKGSKTKDVGLTGSAPPELARTIQDQGRAVGTTARMHTYASLADGEKAIRQRHISVLVVNGERLEWPRIVDEQLRAVVTGAIQLVTVQQRAAAAGISAGALGALLGPVHVENVTLGSVAGRSPGDETVAIVMTGLLLLVIGVYGGLVLGGVVEEKTSRVVEVLLARIPARSLLAGKVAGIGLLGLAQVGLTALAALIATSAVGSLDLPAMRGAVLAWVVVWFVIGYILYATMYGALGALASRPEDAQNVAAPAMAVMVASYFSAFFMTRQPYSGFARVISFVPVSSPFAMPNRIAMGAAAWWEPPVSLVLALAAAAGLVVLGGQIYSGAILHGGPALGLRDVLRGTSPGVEAPEGRTGWLSVRLQKAHRLLERRATMAEKGQAVSTRAMAEISGIGAAIGAAVGVATSDVILGVMAGAGFIGLVTAIARAWTGHGGQRLSHQ